MTVWVDVVARARGLGGRLLTPATIASLAHARDVRDLAVLLAATQRRPAPEITPSPSELEATERQRAAGELRVLERWIAHRTALRPLFESEDVQSLRALLRGAVANAPAAERLTGLIPTSSLPLRTLAQLAACGSPASIAALLDVHGHPYGPALLVEASVQHPDLFTMEHALVATWARRARRFARRAGKAIRTFIRREVDVANCWSILLVAEHGFDGERETLFLEGGELVSKARFAAAIAEKTRPGAVAILDPLVRHTPLAAVTTGAEEPVRAALEREQRALARQDPLGPAPVIEYWLKLRGEVSAVQRIIWAVALQAPVSQRTAGRVQA